MGLATSAIGQPFIAGDQEFSLGSPNAAAGTPASNAVQIVAVGDIAPTIVLSLADNPNFTLHTFLRLTSLQAADFGLLNPVVANFSAVNHLIQNTGTGAFLPPIVGGGLVAIAPPAGDAPPLAGGLQWYQDTTAAIATPAAGTYRILTTVTTNPPFANDVAAFLDTYLMVTP